METLHANFEPIELHEGLHRLDSHVHFIDGSLQPIEIRKEGKRTVVYHGSFKNRLDLGSAELYNWKCSDHLVFDDTAHSNTMTFVTINEQGHLSAWKHAMGNYGFLGVNSHGAFHMYCGQATLFRRDGTTIDLDPASLKYFEYPCLTSNFIYSCVNGTIRSQRIGADSHIIFVDLEMESVSVHSKCQDFLLFRGTSNYRPFYILVDLHTGTCRRIEFSLPEGVRNASENVSLRTVDRKLFLTFSLVSTFIEYPRQSRQMANQSRQMRVFYRAMLTTCTRPQEPQPLIAPPINAPPAYAPFIIPLTVPLIQARCPPQARQRSTLSHEERFTRLEEKVRQLELAIARKDEAVRNLEVENEELKNKLSRRNAQLLSWNANHRAEEPDRARFSAHD